jgi:hypothetical protein
VNALLDTLRAGDHLAMNRLWREAYPGLPPMSDVDAETVMHRARTEASRLELRARAWSHRWLCERGLPSGLPEDLKPTAERIFPRVVMGVGISVNAKGILAPVAKSIQRVMENAVGDAYADGKTDPAFVHERMAEARESELRRLFGKSRPFEERRAL